MGVFKLKRRGSSGAMRACGVSAPALIVGVTVLCFLLFGQAYAQVQGTAHDISVGAGGSCSTCHVPHGASGARLWPVSMSGYETDFGVVGSLCYYCHGTSGGAGLPFAVQELVMTAGSLSHGREAISMPYGDIVDVTLPYGDDAVFQCTTCHDVHSDQHQPFLQDDIDVLCARCHTGRQFVNGIEQIEQGAWGSGNYGINNPGSHPMGIDVFGDQDNPADSPIDIVAAGVFNLPYGESGAHNLGGHLIDGGSTPGSGSGVTCVTCHAVHGVQADSDPAAGGTAPVSNLLTIEQPTSGGAYGGSVYNGNGDPSNALCEGCHYTTATTIDASTGVAYNGSYAPNPGVEDYTHPNDDLGALASAGVSSFPSDWPVGSLPGTNVDPGPICESCHTPHPNNNAQFRSTIIDESGNSILRATSICGYCHGGGGGDHHPAGVPMGSLSDPDIDDGDGTLDCGDCHGGAEQAAHNWLQPGSFNLDPDWEPNTTGGTDYSDNGQTYEETTDKRFVPGSSKECMDCHLSSGSPNPAPYSHHVTGGETEYGEYQDTGEASHYLGDTNAAALNYADGNCPDGTSFNATTMDWPGGGWSRFDSNGLNRIVCESCHELQGSKNVPGTALLLHRYIEGDTDFTSTGGSYASELCEGCHGQSPGGTTHPLTGDIVGNTGAPLDSTSNDPPAANPPGGNATYPGGTSADSMNCDSCHQPHDADTDGGTYIIEDNVTGTASGDTRGVNIPDLRYQAFCKDCHTNY